jgi:hypothetical protein
MKSFVGALSGLALLTCLAACESTLVQAPGALTAKPSAGGTAAGKGSFVGALEFAPSGCEEKGKCQLSKPFAYVDSHGTGWEADKGNWTDGASIPGWAKPIVGQSFDREFVQAAVIHDHYCDRHVRPWEETHWVFFDALRAAGVSEDKAKLMYFAILVGGPKWEKLDPSKTCNAGKGCQKVVPEMIEPRSRLEGSGQQQYLVRKATYGDAKFVTDLKKAEETIMSDPSALSVADIEAMARKARPADYYLKKMRPQT